MIRTRRLQQTLAGLLAWAASHDVRLTDLDARPGSREEAFLAVAQSTGQCISPPPITEEAR